MKRKSPSSTQQLHPVVRFVAATAGLTPREVIGTRRDREVSNARAVAVHLLQQIDPSPTAIGRILNMDHSSVTRAERRIEHDPLLRQQAEQTAALLAAMARNA